MIKILVLEDDPSLMKLMRNMLGGYSLIEAASAEEAIRKFQENSPGIELLIADVTLPVSSGIEVALRLRQEKAALPLILTSGYPVSSWSPRDTGQFRKLHFGSVVVLQKPFQPESLLQSVSELTGERASGMA